jgi:hypothetical protein
MPEERIIEELPPGPTEGGSGGGRWPWPRPGVAELPPFSQYGFTQEAVTELFRLRDRVHALESHALAARLHAGGAGGVLNIPQPWRVAELPPFEAFYRSGGFSGELKGPEYGWNQLVGLLEALLAALRAGNPPPSNPAEHPV